MRRGVRVIDGDHAGGDYCRGDAVIHFRRLDRDGLGHVDDAKAELRVGRQFAFDADEFSHEGDELPVIGSQVADGSAVRRIGEAIERLAAELKARGLKFAHCGINRHALGG